jgi:DNA polymerase-3 subunit alpha
MELIPDYIARKSGREHVDYVDPRLEPILAPTYGVMVYQEQVMQIAQVIGGYTLGSADLLRRAMGKKKLEEMAQQRDIFTAGAEKNGLSRPRRRCSST